MAATRSPSCARSSRPARARCRWIISITALGFAQAAARQGPRGLKHDPPEIIWATNRTVLILIDGEPVLRPVPGAKLAARREHAGVAGS